MTDLTNTIRIALGLGVLSVFALLAGHLALTDIWHGESDLSLEWTILRVAFAVVVLFQATALATLWRILRREASARTDR